MLSPDRTTTPVSSKWFIVWAGHLVCASIHTYINKRCISAQMAYRQKESTCTSVGHVLSLCVLCLLVQMFWFRIDLFLAEPVHILCVRQRERERREQTQDRKRSTFYELTPCTNEYKWALICSTLHGWWRTVCDTSRPSSTDTKGANHYPFSDYLSQG